MEEQIIRRCKLANDLGTDNYLSFRWWLLDDLITGKQLLAVSDEEVLPVLQL